MFACLRVCGRGGKNNSVYQSSMVELSGGTFVALLLELLVPLSPSSLAKNSSDLVMYM